MTARRGTWWAATVFQREDSGARWGPGRVSCSGDRWACVGGDVPCIRGRAAREECLVRFGEEVKPGSIPSYRLWMTAGDVQRMVGAQQTG
jgi:hypothetical protein